MNTPTEDDNDWAYDRFVDEQITQQFEQQAKKHTLITL